ncbi:fumarase, class II [Paenibacillus uliginis N3/975]|uniref:Fumarase, class II n=1 Tax=Paenibacillus uliginis N3/975 TaxID=1313296 RepID=A0A1X7GNP9_9BACL|nr:lyase family protein [Paenibacillus uliginis]SMF72315.1 fumarase, class II [Paenibacillus uliginis N3/975]
MMIRIERDELGAVEVPAYAYYGIQTLRAAQIYPNARTPVHHAFIVAMAYVKIAAAKANLEIGALPQRIGNLIVMAAEEILRGKHLKHFISNYSQSPSGDILNANMNEVLANRALEFMLEDKGNYGVVNPELHANLSQSANGVMSATLRIAAYRLTQDLIKSLHVLKTELLYKKEQIDRLHTPKISSQNSGAPIWLGRQFGDYAQHIQSDVTRLDKAASHMKTIHLSLSAIGSEPDSHCGFNERAVSHLRKLTQIELFTSKSEEVSYHVFAELSSALKDLAVNLSRLCSDIRLGASLEQADINPTDVTMHEKAASLSQSAFQVIGLDHSISLAAEAGMLDRNAVPPIITYNVMESLSLLINGIELFTLDTSGSPNPSSTVFR